MSFFSKKENNTQAKVQTITTQGLVQPDDGIWNNMTEEIRQYCFDWGVDKTKRDFIKTFLFCLAVCIALVVSIFKNGGKFDLFQFLFLVMLVATPVFVYIYSKKFQEALQGVIQSSEAVYTFAVLKNVDIQTEVHEGVSQPDKVNTFYTFLFENGTESTFNTVVEKAKIGDRILFVKRKGNMNIASKNCFKIKYIPPKEEQVSSEESKIIY